MGTKSTRLFFIDAIRAWAILMMLQGHFVDGLLDPLFRNAENSVYTTWLYFRGITAPVFFTISGFIFTYLLIRAPQLGLDNPRVKKGINRGLQLLLIGYLLRLNIFGLLGGKIYEGFYVVDVLHCIGLAILFIIGMYLLAAKRKSWLFPMLLFGTTMVLFVFEPVYKQWSFDFLPNALANYFTKANGSVFTIIPWLGYATLGGSLAVLFRRFSHFKQLYTIAVISCITVGLTLIFKSSDFFVFLYELTEFNVFKLIEQNNYLFIRLGDVFVVFALFIMAERLLKHATVLRIGQNTLSIYVIHFIILYGSFTGLGLYRFFKQSLTPGVTIFGALLFMIACTALALWYDTNEVRVKGVLAQFGKTCKTALIDLQKTLLPQVRLLISKVRVIVFRIFALARANRK